ncbi:methionyl-tRNA formyltransferase [Microbispora cellulosiformans]|uniref:Methionyl-tRNA formyltransferase n=2 Tax=Streptosporangiaceae TaxID=2004 RepID=A0A5J5JVT4_9ACTN|nr:methionyl-tRNA formyltransferase [Microbispora cellulosiformans]
MEGALSGGIEESTSVTNGLRVVLVSFAVSGFRLLYETCVQAGHTPVAFVHARSLRQQRTTSRRSAETMADIGLALPPGMDLLLPGTAGGVAKALAGYQADLIVVYGCPWKLTREGLRTARLGAINVHTSLLPRYRGPIPVHWAVRNGDPETGVSIHWMDEEFDSGNILAQKGGIQIQDDLVTERLWREIDEAIAELLPGAIELAAAGAEGEPQDEAGADYGSWMEPDFMFVDWRRGAREIHNQVRVFRFGLFGQRGPFARIDGEWMTLLRTALAPADGVEMTCGDGPIWITEMTPAIPPDR